VAQDDNGENKAGPSGTPAGFRSGFVALCGRPNVGKSTLLNALLGQDIALATRFPQTTRERMLGIWHEEEFQAVLVDTPGIHRAKSALNKYMVDEALRGAKEVDLVLLLAEMPQLRDPDQAHEWQPGPGALAVFESLRDLGRPMALILTKCDRLKDPRLMIPVLEHWQKLHDFTAIIPTSATEKTGLDNLREQVLAHLPVGEALYDADHLSDRSMRWHASECVRAELFANLGDELPYSCAVTVNAFRSGRTRDRVSAVVHVERKSQKGIVIGAKGRTVKAISQGARARIAELTGRPCDLYLDVRVTENWTRDPKKLESLGYQEEGGR
jgi:GTP-binding protein Era